MTKGEQALLVAGIGATATVLVAVIGALATYFSSKRDRRRVLYSNAVKAAVAWKEQLYRVRRRRAGDDVAAALVQSFHELQDELTYQQAWIGSESKYMGRSYDRLVRGVKTKTEPQITAAWAEEVRALPGNAVDGEVHPDIEALVEAFLKDVRAHLSPLFVRKIGVACRNTKSKVAK